MASTQLEELYETTLQQKIVFEMDWIIWLLMIPGNGRIKLSALSLYRRKFAVHKHGPFDIITKVGIAVCALWTAGFWLAQIFGCGIHFKNPFGILAEVASCNTNIRLTALMISDLVTNILVWLLPITAIWQLNMNTTRKVQVTGILSLAAVSLAAAVVRIIVQEEITDGGYAAYTDPNLTLTILLYWSMLESGLATTAACLPTLHLVAIGSLAGSAVGSVRQFWGIVYSSSKSSTTLDGDQRSREDRAGRVFKPGHDPRDVFHELNYIVHSPSDIENERC